MKKYNKVFLSLWLLFSAITLAFMIVFVLNNLAGMIGDVEEMIENEGSALSFFLLFFASEIIGFIVASLVIDHVHWICYMHGSSLQ
jgi:phosphotransferase system  glucose/maltose/N-acetylglucosamine-specific IIC component